MRCFGNFDSCEPTPTRHRPHTNTLLMDPRAVERHALPRFSTDGAPEIFHSQCIPVVN